MTATLDMLCGAPVPLIAGLTADDAALVLAALRPRRFRPGSVLLAAGDRPTALFVLRSGTADVEAIDGDGRRRCLNRLGPGATIGEVSLLTGQPASATVRATANVEVLALGADSLERLGVSCPRLARNLACIVSERLAGSTRLTLGRPPAGVTQLREDGPPSLLSYALAASLAWHTRGRPALLVFTDEPAPELEALRHAVAAPCGGLSWTGAKAQPPGAATLILAPSAGLGRAAREELVRDWPPR